MFHSTPIHRHPLTPVRMPYPPPVDHSGAMFAAQNLPLSLTPTAPTFNPRRRQEPDETMGDILVLAELNWFTNDEHIVVEAKTAGVSLTHKDIAFLEHRCNGKSKGIAHVKCKTTDDLTRLYQWFSSRDFQGKRINVSVTSSFVPKHKRQPSRELVRIGDERTTPLPFMPTNSHGGVNFNRVPMHHRQQVVQMQQAGFFKPHFGPPGSTRTMPAELVQRSVLGGSH